ncbi:MAG: hypothetical protein EAY75_11520 [Bacteroidetes bacterium]|nr:MAG: hypothetical protein EAY75_11520 [Bacteroidota bacterium]
MKQLLLSMFTLLVVFSSQAQWNGISTENNPVATVANTSTAAKSDLLSVPDGLGNAWVVWRENRGTDGIYAQRINFDGSLAFAAGGIVVRVGAGSPSNVSVTPDLTGGIEVVWQDSRNSATTGNDVFGQRITAAGTVAFAANGIDLVGSAAAQTAPVVTAISATAFAVVWRDDRNSLSLDLYTNYFNTNTGAPVFSPELLVVSAANSQSSQQVVADGNGGVAMVWSDGRVSNSAAIVYAQRFNAAGDRLWGGDGLVVWQQAGANPAAPSLARGSNGSYGIVWTDTRAGATDANVFAQLVSADGVLGFSASSLLICNATGSQSNPYITASGTGFITTWRDPRAATSNADVFVQSFDATGVKWTANGVQVTNAAGNQPNSGGDGLLITSDGAGGAVVVWDDAEFGTSNIDVRAQRINASGAAVWTANGVAVANRTASNQRIPELASDGSGNIIVSWVDSRTITSPVVANNEIFASRLQTDGTLPLTNIALLASNVGGKASLRWKTSGEKDMLTHTIERQLGNGRFTAIGSVAAKNDVDNAYDFVDASLLNGQMTYRIKAADRNGVVRYSNVATVVLRSAGAPALVVFPNPVKSSFTVWVQAIPAGQYSVRTLSSTGAILGTRNLVVTEAGGLLQLSAADLQVGLNVVQVVNANGKPLLMQKVMRTL